MASLKVVKADRPMQNMAATTTRRGVPFTSTSRISEKGAAGRRKTAKSGRHMQSTRGRMTACMK